MSTRIHNGLFLFTILVIASTLTLPAQQVQEICTDFQTKSTEGWTQTGVGFAYPPGGPTGNYDYYLRCADLPGASQVFSPDRYHGDWTRYGTMGCGGVLSWDVCMFNDGDAYDVFEWRPMVLVQGGGFEARFNAPFKIAETGPLAGWHHVEAYFAPGPEPSPGWVMRSGTNADWNTLLRNVTRIIYGYDHTSYQTEEYGLDNICLRDSVCEAICGTKYNDLNGNGILNSGEPVIRNWTFHLSNGISDWTTTTDENGNFCFWGIPPGTYVLSEEIPDGWEATMPRSGEYIVTMHENDYQEFIFLNHIAEPPCDSVRDVSLDRSNCTYRLRIKNVIGTAITDLGYKVEGGTLQSLSTSPCAAEAPQAGVQEDILHFPAPCPGDFWIDIQVEPETKDTYIFVEFTLFHEGGQTCVVSIFYKCPMSGTGECSITMPDKLEVLNYEYSPNPFDVHYKLTNTGNGSLDVAKIQLILPPRLTTTDPLTIPVSALGPNQEHALSWSVRALREASASDEMIEIVALTADDRVLVRCLEDIHLPPVPDMTCDIIAPDHIAYDETAHSYTPDPFEVQMTVYNHLDVMRTNIEAEIDLSNAPHLKLAPGETAIHTLPQLMPGVSGVFKWDLTTDITTADVNEKITVRYRLDGYTGWRECIKTISIAQGMEPYLGACFADGIDSVWFNSTHEVLVPSPFQVFCKITNSGGVRLTNCKMALKITSPDITVYSTQWAEWKPLLHPGETGVMMYMLSAAQDIQETIETLEFVFTCDELEEIICTHTVYVEGRDPIDHTRSHKRLYFIAEQYGPLPNPIPVLVFAGFPTEIPWQADGMPSWLDIAPSNAATAAYADVAPNTTSLPIGRYNGNFSIASAAPNSPSGIEVVYDVVDAVDAVPAISESPRAVRLGAAYPNPFSTATTIAYRLDTRSHLTLEVYNILGEKVRTVFTGEQGPGPHTVDFNAAELPDGPYRIVLRSGTDMQSRMVVVSQ